MFGWLVEKLPTIAAALVALPPVLAGVINLLNALTTWRKARLAGLEPSQALADTNRVRVLSLQGDPIKPSSFLALQKVLTVIAACTLLPLIAVGIWAFFLAPSWKIFLSNLVFLGFAVAMVFAARSARNVDPQQSSKVKRETKISLEGDYDRIWDSSLKGLKRIGVEVRSADVRKGTIEGTTGMNWLSFGEIIVVHIGQIAERECSVQVKSDSKLTTTRLDYGKNASNIRKFIHELTR
jgi:hypothetical protein